MEKIINVICPSCGKIDKKKEFEFLDNVIQGKSKESCKIINDKQINGIEYCAICR